MLLSAQPASVARKPRESSVLLITRFDFMTLLFDFIMRHYPLYILALNVSFPVIGFLLGRMARKKRMQGE